MSIAYTVSKLIVTLRGEPDYRIFGAREVRDVLKCRAHCLRAGFTVTDPVIFHLNQIRSYYLVRVGLATYLSEMLGNVATSPIHKCALYDLAGRPVKLDFAARPDQPLQKYIADKFLWDEIPARVEVSKAGRVEVRYL